jgi:hypothetical protein
LAYSSRIHVAVDAHPTIRSSEDPRRHSHRCRSSIFRRPHARLNTKSSSVEMCVNAWLVGDAAIQPASHPSNPIQPWVRHVSGFEMRHSQRSDSDLLLVGGSPRPPASKRILVVYLVGAPRFCPVSGQWASATKDSVSHLHAWHHPKPIGFFVSRNTKPKMRVVLFERIHGRSRAVQTATTVLIPDDGWCHPVPTIPFLQVGTLAFTVCSLDKECGPTDSGPAAGSRQTLSCTHRGCHISRDPLERDGAPPMEAAGTRNITSRKQHITNRTHAAREQNTSPDRPPGICHPASHPPSSCISPFRTSTNPPLATSRRRPPQKRQQSAILMPTRPTRAP